MASNINFNLNPYYDDFDENKNFQRVLFRPGYAVQARELTQLQTILQSQIEKFGKHIFKDGSIVLGGQFGIQTNLDTVKISSSGSATQTDLSTLVGKVIIGNTSGVKAYVLDVAYKADWNLPEDILFVNYLSSGTLTNFFLATEQFRFEETNDTVTYTIKATTPLGKGSYFTIEPGVVFSRGFFVSFEKQNIILDPSNQNPTCKVGFDSVLSIVGSNDDQSLLDPALGSYNYSAPGADRVKLTTTLKRVAVDAETSLPDFSSLFTIKNGSITEYKERTEYARLYDEFAKRTNDESGDYVVNGFGVRVREHLDTGVNEGYLTSPLGNVNSLAIGVEPGLAYVKGYEVNNLTTNYLEIDKSLDYLRINSEILSARNGNYFVVQQTVGKLALDTAEVVSLYNAAESRVLNKIASTTSPSGTKIGEAKVKAFEYEGTTQYRIYLFDIVMSGTYNLSQARAIGNANFFSDIVLTDSVAKLNDTLDSTLLYPLGSDYTRSVRTTDDSSSDTTFTFKRSAAVTVTTGGIFSVTVGPTNETHSYGTTGTLSSLDKTTIVLTLETETANLLPGTVNVSGNTVTGTTTSFTRLNVGDRVLFSSNASIFTIASITNDLSMTLVESIGTPITGQTISKKYFVGDIVNLSGKGAIAGTERSVSISTNKILNFDLKENFTSTVAATVSFNCSRNAAKEVNKTLVPSVYVQINCAALSSLTNPIRLGFSDVFAIKQIRKHSAAFTSNTEGTLVTSLFNFDNGQRDDLYDHAYITPKTGNTLTTADKLLVELDYFKPDFSEGFGYFSIDSYPINDTTESSTTIFTHEVPYYTSVATGTEYNLRKYLDYRPVKLNTSADSFTPSGATVNPGTTNSFNTDTNGLRIPIPSTQIVCDYSYYIARRDVIVSDKDGNFKAVRGVPDIYPVTPLVSENFMGIANIFIPPYPSLASTYARILNKTNQGAIIDKITYKRHTMRDIGVLKQRIENLEYYNTVTLLEKNTADLLILDSNGLDRFKNGFFVDGFVDHSLGATYNIDYKICVDKSENVIRPYFEMDSFAYDYNAVKSVNTTNTGGLITLPYTESVMIDQPKVTTFRNIEQSVFRFIGKVTLSPDIDVWVDDTVVDKIIDLGNDIPNSSLLTTEWNSWQTYIAGNPQYKVYARNYGERSGDVTQSRYIGTYSSYSAAVAVAGKQFAGRAYIETINTTVRPGSQSIQATEKIQENFGNFITDVSIAPYIRPQTIDILVRGLKANTQYYTYFDGENMSSYVSPAVIPESDTFTVTSLPKLAEGATWKTNSYGILYGSLRLPSSGKKFRIGSKEVVVTDSITNDVDATSYGKAFFVASGLNAQKQNTILSTKTPVITTTPPITATAQKVEIFGPSCMAYSFMPKVPAGESGVFLTSVDVFVKSKSSTLGVWFEIREMDNSGGITRNQVPYSEVWYKSSEIITTADATTPHKVTFPAPVFLLNNTQYAFVIHTEGLNPDTYFWVSRLGGTDVITNNPVTGRQLTGTLYTTNNNLNWDIVPDVDLKVRFNRASFASSLIGTAYLGNDGYEFLNISTPATSYTSYGETIKGSQIATLTGITGGTIIVGDKIQQSANIANVVSISGASYYTEGFNYVLGAVTILDSTGNSKSITATVSSLAQGTGKLMKYDSTTNQLRLSDSTGNFFANAKIVGVTTGTTSTVNSFSEFKYSVLTAKPKSLQLLNTSCDFYLKGITYSSNTFADFVQCAPDSIFELKDSFTLKPRSKEIVDFASETSSNIKATLISTSEYVSPVIDTNGANVILVNNIINNDYTNEDKPNGGNLLNRYISKIVTLAEGQDAEDLMVMLTAYLPPNSDVKVWMKIRNVEDGDLFENKSWIELERNNPGVFSSYVNTNDFKEFTYNIPAASLTGVNGAVQYTSSNGNTYTGFKQYSIKIGLMGTDSAIVPKVGDLKAIALQK